MTCVKPQGALFLTPRLDPQVYDIEDDQAFVIELLRATHILIANGTGFNRPEPDHIRIVTLPRVDDLRYAIERIAGFLETKRRRTRHEQLCLALLSQAKVSVRPTQAMRSMRSRARSCRCAARSAPALRMSRWTE